MRIGGWRQIGAHRQKFDALVPLTVRLERYLRRALVASAMVRHRMLSGVSLPPRLRGLT